MECTAVVGLQWGDEAKGKIVDLLTDQHDFVVRYNGGANAGHTIVCDGKTFKLSLLPTGVIRPTVQSVIGNGVVVYPPRFLEEVANLRAAGVPVGANLALSDRAHVILPYHMEEERLSEAGSGSAIGTTGRGIGPCYADKAGRAFSVRIGDLLHPEYLKSRLEQIGARKDRFLKALSPAGYVDLDVNALTQQYAEFGQQMKPHIVDTTRLLQDGLARGKRILFEAAQGSLLDVDHGTYPYVTSSNSTVAGIWAGSGVSARRLKRIIGIIKAYSTRVGRGPFPTELNDATGERIRQVGREYGTVTGRPRRTGWFDAVAVRYSAALNDVDELALMLLDVLSEFGDLQICTGYKMRGEKIEHFPPDALALEQCEPVYETLPGWQKDVSGVRKLADLPGAARRYIDRVQEVLQKPISIVSVGPDRVQTIFCS